MFDFQEKRKIRGLLYSKPLIGLLFVLAILLGMGAYERFVIEREMSARLEAKQVELEKLSERAGDLRAKVEHLKNNRGIEEELRSRFDVAKEGEKVIVIVDKQSGTTTLDALSQPPGTGQNNAEGSSFFDFLKFW